MFRSDFKGKHVAIGDFNRKCFADLLSLVFMRLISVSFRHLWMWEPKKDSLEDHY